MKYITVGEHTVPIVADADVFIAGGGCAGVGAAIAAARAGLKVFMAERLFCLGGMMSAGLMSKIAIAPQNQGLATELIERMDALQGTNYLKSRPEVPIDPETAKTVLDEVVINECKVDVHFGTVVSGVIKDDRVIRAVLLSSIEGEQAVTAKYYIDCTGDGQLGFLAGAKCMAEGGGSYSSSPTLMFRVGNCDLDKLYHFMVENRELMESEYVTYKRHLMPPEKWRGNIDNELYAHMADFVKYIRLKCAERRDLFSEADETVLLRRGLLFMNQPAPGHVLVNSTTRPEFIGTTNRDVSDAVVDGRRQARIMHRFMKAFIPGFENSYLMDTAQILGVRESRRIKGDYILTQEDVESLRRFDDAICSNHGGVEIHKGSDNDGLLIRELGDRDCYDVPYRCVTAYDFDNLFVAGRCFSATHEALSAARNIAYCCALGEACGTAAGQLIKAGKTNVRDIDSALLRKALSKNIGG